MGKAMYCDRCEELFNTSEIEVSRVKLVGVFQEDLKADLCTSCCLEMEKFLYGDDLKKKK